MSILGFFRFSKVVGRWKKCFLVGGPNVTRPIFFGAQKLVHGYFGVKLP